MIRKLCIATILFALAASTGTVSAKSRLAHPDANGNLDALIAKHAAANNVPEDLVRRIIKRESGGNPGIVSKGNYGLMQIKLATARSMGYTGNAAGLLDADTNMTYAVKYLAGAYHIAGGNTGRAVHYYAAGYYYAAKAKSVTPRIAGATVAQQPAADTLAMKPIRVSLQSASVSSSSDMYSGRVDFH